MLVRGVVVLFGVVAVVVAVVVGVVVVGLLSVIIVVIIIIFVLVVTVAVGIPSTSTSGSCACSDCGGGGGGYVGERLAVAHCGVSLEVLMRRLLVEGSDGGDDRLFLKVFYRVANEGWGQWSKVAAGRVVRYKQG